MSGIHPKNLTAQLAYRGIGNPPSTHPSSAISNAFPGLEMDIRNLWRRIFEGITLHEASNLVVDVETGHPDVGSLTKNDFLLISVEGQAVTTRVTGPKTPGGKPVDLPDAENNEIPLEWSNALADIVHAHTGQKVICRFRRIADKSEVELLLRVRPVFEPDQVVISRELSPPGQLSQSLCSPWQNDYRECACFYWAASRPDYVNVEPGPDGTSIGHNWMQRDRDSSTPKEYLVDDRRDSRLVTYVGLFQQWERELKFEIDGQDE